MILFQFLGVSSPSQKNPVAPHSGRVPPGGWPGSGGCGRELSCKNDTAPPTHAHPRPVTSRCRIDDNIFLPYTLSPFARFCCRLCDFHSFGQWWPFIFSSEVSLTHRHDIALRYTDKCENLFWWCAGVFLKAWSGRLRGRPATRVIVWWDTPEQPTISLTGHISLPEPRRRTTLLCWFWG